MSLGAGIALLLGVAAAVWVAVPLLRKDTDRGHAPDSEELGRARELQSEHEMLLASLRDLEDDRESDKIDTPDYEELRVRLSARAMEVMKALDEIHLRRTEEAERAMPRPIRHPKSHGGGSQA